MAHAEQGPMAEQFFRGYARGVRTKGTVCGFGACR
jgi:hypothetical protein